MSDQFPNGSSDERDHLLAEAVRKAARETTPDAGFVTRLEARLRMKAQSETSLPNAFFVGEGEQGETLSTDGHANARLYETREPERFTEEIPTMQAQKIAVRNRETPLIPLPLAAAVTAAIAIGALILMMSLNPRPAPSDNPVAGMIQATATPPSPTVDPLQMTATAIIAGATQTAAAPTPQPNPLVETAVAIIEQATAWSALPQEDQVATQAALEQAFATESAINMVTREVAVRETREAILASATAVEAVELWLTATAVVAEATPTVAPFDASAAPVLVQAKGNASVRLTPDVNGSTVGVIHQVSWYVATARSDSWIQIEYADSPGGIGWVFSGLVNVQGNVESLPELLPPPPIPVGGWVSDFSEEAVEAMRVRHLSWVALPLPYHMLLEGQTDPMVAVAKTMITAAQAQGFKVMLTIFGDPAEFGDDYDHYVEMFAAFNGSVAALGPDAIQVWSEPNIDHSWTTGEIDAAAYVQMLEAAYTAIKEANPSVTVITAALAPTGAQNMFPQNVVNDDVYYQDMADAGAAEFADCIGVEYVEGVLPPTETSGDERGDYATYYLAPMIQRAAVPFRESGLPVCMTALGYASFEFTSFDDMPGFEWARGTSWQEQYELTQQAIETMASLSSVRVQMAIIFRLDPLGDHLTELYAIWRTNPPPMVEPTQPG